MKNNEVLLNNLSEHIDANAECQKRFMLLVARALPHTDGEIADLMGEWHRVNKEINDELKQLTQN